MSLMLTDADLEELTGASQPAAQIRVLREHGLHPFIRRDGRPRITWAAVTAACTRTADHTPNFEALRRAS